VSPVRVHTDARAAGASEALNARAFAFGSHVFLGAGERPTDLGLIAHEVSHVVQQTSSPRVQLFSPGGADPLEREAHTAATAVVQRRPFSVQGRTPPRVQRLGLGDVRNKFADWANVIPGYRMLTILIGINPINMAPVPKTPANIFRALIEFIPGGGLVTKALDNYGIFDKIANWVGEQVASLGVTAGMFIDAIKEFISGLHLSDVFHLGDVWDRAKRIFTGPIDKLINFAKGLITGIIKFIKDAILKPLAKLAEGTRGWDLLIAVIGRNPVTGDAVPRTAETLIPGFLKLIGQEEVWANMQKSNAIGRAWAWFQGAMAALMGFVGQIPSLFIAALKSLTLEDIILVPLAFAKVGKVFGNFIGDFISWGLKAVWNLLEIIFDVVSPGALGYIKKTGAALKSILKNPLPFVGNLVKAAKLGFQNFASNFGTHLKAGLIDWLTGSLPGIYIPKGFTLVEIAKFAFSVLGLTWQNIRQKLVKATSETVVKAMETGFDIVKALVTGGAAAAWEKIKEQLANLKDMVISGITDFVVDMVVKKAIPKLVAMFIPGAGFISAILSIYDSVMVFVNKIKTIIQVVTGFVDSIVAIASGAIGTAASKVEGILARLLSLAINFLAGFAGLGKVADKVMGIIQKVRAPIDKALDWLIGWIVNMAKRVGRFLAGGARAAVAGVRGLVLRFTQHKSFAAAGETHETWVTEAGEPQVASAAMPLGTRIGTWRRRLASLPAAQQANVSADIALVAQINTDMKAAAQNALRARTAGNAAAVDAAQAVIDQKQAALQPALARLFTAFGDTRTPAGSADEARLFALMETYDRVVVPLKASGQVAGTPGSISQAFRGLWNADMIPQARGFATQMERALAAARNVGTGRFPYLTGVEVRIPGTRVDYTTRDHDEERQVDFDVATEVKNWGAMRARSGSGGTTITVAQQVTNRIATLRNQIQSALRGPYQVAALEVRGVANIPQELRDALAAELVSYRALARTLNKRFVYRRI